MTATAAPDRRSGAPRGALTALLAGNFAVGIGVMAPTGVLPDIAADLATTLRTAGALVWAGALVLALGAPLMAWATASIDRRHLLTGVLAAGVAGNVASALAPDFATLLPLRILSVLGAAVFTPQAVATAALLVPAERRAGAIAYIFLGWSVAAACGLPFVSMLSALTGWRTALLLIAGIGAAGTLAVAATLPRGLHGHPVSVATWVAVARDPRLLATLGLTALTLSGVYATIPYVLAILVDGAGLDRPSAAAILAVQGVAGVSMNAVAGRVAGRLGIDGTVTMLVSLMAAGALVWSVGHAAPMLVLLGVVLWGSGGFAANSMQQARLTAMAPQLAGATVSLNTSAIYLGQAIGTPIGGWALAFGAGGPPLATAAVCAVAAALSMAIGRQR